MPTVHSAQFGIAAQESVRCYDRGSGHFLLRAIPAALCISQRLSRRIEQLLSAFADHGCIRRFFDAIEHQVQRCNSNMRLRDL